MYVFRLCLTSEDGVALDVRFLPVFFNLNVVLVAPAVVSVEDFLRVAPSVSFDEDSMAGVSFFSELKSAEL